MPTVTQYRPTFPPGDESTATAGDEAIDVGRIITNPNWTRDSKPTPAEPAPIVRPRRPS